MNHEIIITCKLVRYYTEIDEDYFFEWLDQIPAIFKIDGQNDELYLHINSEYMTSEQFNELTAIFKRYKIPKIQQLKALHSKVSSNAK